LAVEPPTIDECFIVYLSINGERIINLKKRLVNNFFMIYSRVMKESEIEKHLVWTVDRAGGRTYKFTSPGRKGVADRIVCLDGQTWFIELKTKGGRLSELQKIFAAEMKRLNQKYACLWTKEGVDEWAKF
jgi:hypothetical protein